MANKFLRIPYHHNLLFAEVIMLLRPSGFEKKFIVKVDTVEQIGYIFTKELGRVPLDYTQKKLMF